MVELLKLIQVVISWLSFFIILYWVLELNHVNFPALIDSFFTNIKALVIYFYSKKILVNGTPVDFSYFFAAVSCLIIAWLMNFVISGIYYLEGLYEKFNSTLKRGEEKKFNKKLEKEYITEEKKNNNLLFLVKFDAKFLDKTNSFSKAFDMEDSEKELLQKTEVRILQDFFENIEGNLNCKEKLFKDSIALFFDNVEELDDILFTFKNIVKNLNEEYGEENIEVNFFAAIDVYAKEAEIDLKIEKLKQVINIGLRNKIACLATFKQRLALIKTTKYTVEEHGIYEIFKNEMVFFLKKL